MSEDPFDLDAIIASAPGVAIDDTVSAARLELELVVDQIHATSHYAILRVPMEASPSTIAAAYDAIAATHHPSRLSADLADVVDKAYIVFARAFVALVVLTDAERRKEYDADLVGNGGVVSASSESTRVFGAESHASRSESALKIGDARTAELGAAVAVQNDPEMVGYLSTLAAAYAARVGEKVVDDVVMRALDVLEACIARDPLLEPAYVARARIFRRAGHEREARAEYLRALKVNERNADAMRELDAPTIAATKTAQVEKPIVDAPAKPRSRGRSRALRIGAALAIVGAATGAWALNVVPTERRVVHDLLVEADAERLAETGPSQIHDLDMPKVHEPELDALGLEGTAIVVEYLRDDGRAETSTASLDVTMRECALHYLARYAERVSVPPPPKALVAIAQQQRGAKGSELDWNEQAQLWTAWLGDARSRSVSQ